MKIMKTKMLGKVMKIVMIIVAVISVNFAFANPVNAAKDVTLNSIVDTGRDWLKTGEENAGDYASPDKFVKELIPVGQILVGIGIATLTIVSVVMAIQWIIATPDKQAQLKKQLIGVVVAAFVIFGAVGIWELIQNIMNNSGLV